MASILTDSITAIEREGYAYIPQLFSQDEVSECLRRVKFWYEKSLSTLSDRTPRFFRDQHVVHNLQNKDIFFIRMMLGNELIGDILKHFLNDQWFKSLPADAPNYILRSFLARSSNVHLPMHIDSWVPYTGSHVFVMQCAILLEDQTEENGCTVIVPRSHLSDQYAPQEAFETAVSVEGKAGSLVVWDSRTWHGAHANRSGGTRWSMIGTFCRWWIKQLFDMPGNLPQEIYDQLTDHEKAVIGYCSVPYDDETFGVDMKRSFDLLPKRVEDYRL